MLNWMKIMAVLCVPLLAPPSEKESVVNHVLNFPQFADSTVEISPELMEYDLGMKPGELEELTVLTLPEKGRLISGGVEVERGETLLRWELEELYYLPDSAEGDWFAVCGENLCAVVNLKALN